MKHLICVNVGPNRYPVEYVNKLVGAVRRNSTGSVEYWCVTDDDSGLDMAIQTLTPLNGLPGWWQKMSIFSLLFKKSDRVLFLDLDVVITGSLDPIFDYPSDWAMHPDFQKPWRPASAVMLFSGDIPRWIWREFANDQERVMSDFHGDQDYLYSLQQQQCRWDGKREQKPYCDLLPQQWVRSFKIHATDGPPFECRIVAFHGRPKPHECGGWVEHRW